MSRRVKTATEALAVTGWTGVTVEPSGSLDSDWRRRQDALRAVGWRACTVCRAVLPTTHFGLQSRKRGKKAMHSRCWPCRLSVAVAYAEQRASQTPA